MLSLEKKKRLDTEHLVLFKLVFHQSSSSFSTHTYFCLESKNRPSANRELIQDKPKVRCWSSFLGYPQVVTHVYVHESEGLQNQDSTGGEGGGEKPNFDSRVANVAAWTWICTLKELWLWPRRCWPLRHHPLWGAIRQVHRQEGHLATGVQDQRSFLQEEAQEAHNGGGETERWLAPEFAPCTDVTDAVGSLLSPSSKNH